MLAPGFQKDMNAFWKTIPHKVQTALFSATDLVEEEAFIETYLEKPEKVKVFERSGFQEKGAKNSKIKLTHEVYFIKDSSRKSLLKKVLRRRSVKKAIVFVNTKLEAEEALKDLQKAYITSKVLHGDKSQAERMESLAQFKRNKFKVLIATDLVSRGLNINDLDHVVHYHPPKDATIYKHRVGRLCRERLTRKVDQLLSRF